MFETYLVHILGNVHIFEHANKFYDSPHKDTEKKTIYLNCQYLSELSIFIWIVNLVVKPNQCYYNNFPSLSGKKKPTHTQG